MASRIGRRSLEDLPRITDHLTWMIEQSGKSQTQISEQLGYSRPNIVSMWKSGKTALPLGKVESLARICRVDPAFTMQVVLSAYYPDLLDFIERYPGLTLSPEESELIEASRSCKWAG